MDPAVRVVTGRHVRDVVVQVAVRLGALGRRALRVVVPMVVARLPEALRSRLPAGDAPRPAAGTGPGTADLMRAVRDGLRGGLSLRVATQRAVEQAGQQHVLGDLAADLLSGKPAAAAFELAASSASETDVAFALVVLSVHARAGGDPAPAVAAVEARLRTRVKAARQARSLTAQARVSARALLVITPGFLGLFALLDPAGTWRAVSAPGARFAVLLGFMLQLAAAAWIRRIVDAPTRDGRRAVAGGFHSLPVLRVFGAIARGRPPAARADDVAYAADLVSLLLGAGVSPARAIELASRVVPGPFGTALRDATAAIRAGESRRTALERAASVCGGPDAERFVEAFGSATALGVPLADTLRSLAEDIRDANAADLEERVRIAGVKVLVPLSLLILPAFVLSCLVPLFVGGLKGISL